MSKMTLAASLVSAGLAVLITEHFVEKRLLREFDERMQIELDASVIYLEETGKAEPTFDYLDEKEEREKRVFGTKFDITKPTLDDLKNKNQRTRYDAIVREEYGGGQDPTDQEMDEVMGEIYSITTDEYLNNESGYFQSTLTYCRDGGVLDEDGDLVVDHPDLIGDATPPFGENSGEPHIVYLRNAKIQREFEVVNDPDVDSIVSLGDPEGYVT